MNAQGIEPKKRIRYLELDFIKTLAIILMILEHSVECLSSFDMDLVSPTGFLQNAVEFSFGYLCTSLFLFSMGFGIAFTRKTTPAEFLKRARNLLILALSLNFLRNVIPYLISSAMSGGFNAVALFKYFFLTDILNYAAVLYLFTALLIKLKVPYYAYLPIGIFLRFVSVPLAGVEVESPVLNVLLDYFLPVGETSFFPFLNFYFYSAAGMLIGKIFADRQISTRTFKVIFWECTALLAGFFLSAKFNGFNLKDFYDLSSDSMQSPLHPMMFKFIPAALILLITFALFHFLLLKIDKNGPVLRFARFCGVHLNTIYIVHWILIAYLSLLFDILDFKLSFEMTMLAGLAITVVSLIITRLLPDVNLSQNLSLPGKKKPQVSDHQ